MSLTERFFCLIASSATADYKSTNGSEFTIQFQDPIKIPKQAQNIHASVTAAEVWNNFKNISAGRNKLYITYNNASYVITFPDGQYSLSSLQNALERELTNASASPSLIKLSADEPSQRVEIIFQHSGVSVDFKNHPDTIRELLGFDAKVITSALIGEYKIGDSTANFNTINSLLVHSSLVNQGIQINGNFSQTIAQIFIDSEPSTQVLYRPFVPTPISADHLAGQLINSINFRLTNELNQNVDTNGENWSLRLKISYYL